MVTENSHQHFDVSISDFLYFVFGYTPPPPPQCIAMDVFIAFPRDFREVPPDMI